MLARIFYHYLDCDQFSFSTNTSYFMDCNGNPFKDYFDYWTEFARKQVQPYI